MKKLQRSYAAKLCAWAVLLLAAFAACVFGFRTLLCVPAVTSDSWQSTGQFSNAQSYRRRDLMESVYLSYRLNVLERMIAEGSADASQQSDAEVLRESREAARRRFSRENTWFRYRLMDAGTGEVADSNLGEGESMLRTVRSISRETFTVTEESWSRYGYEYYRGGDYGAGSYEYAGPEAPALQPADTASVPVKLVLEYGVPEEVDSSIQDEFFRVWLNYKDDQLFFDEYLSVFFTLSALALVALIWVLWTAGHSPREDGIVLTWQEKIFLEIYAAVLLTAMGVLMYTGIRTADQAWWYAVHSLSRAVENYGQYELFSTLLVMGAAALLTGAAAAGSLLLRTFVVRIKAGSLARTTLLCRVAAWTVRTVHEFVSSLPITWKAVAAVIGYTVLSMGLITQAHYSGGTMLIYLFLQLALLVFVAWWTLHYVRLREGTKTIAKGDLEYQIDTRRMPHDLRLQAEDLNNISAGLSSAVDEKMKSERFKAELITNVSHDLKTPLTSIINYVNLLKSTEQTDPAAVEYIEVLDRKSQRLKKLTEDLVEASKASTGVLSAAREKIGMSQLIDQALGEWEEKLTGRRLTLVTALPEGETWVYADGRHLWRVVDNLLSNCAKYAMEGTRIYLDLERGKGQVVLSVKNISREPLNVPAERLMERFVRGEESRTTEGSGLGLSIARSLTELQGGTFELAVDGDLFKAIVTLPQAS